MEEYVRNTKQKKSSPILILSIFFEDGTKLKTFSKIIYIKTPLKTIINRIDAGQERGLAVPDGLSISEVYSEREHLYDNHAQFILDGSKSINELVELVNEIIND